MDIELNYNINIEYLSQITMLILSIQVRLESSYWFLT